MATKANPNPEGTSKMLTPQQIKQLAHKAIEPEGAIGRLEQLAEDELFPELIKAMEATARPALDKAEENLQRALGGKWTPEALEYERALNASWVAHARATFICGLLMANLGLVALPPILSPQKKRKAS